MLQSDKKAYYIVGVLILLGVGIWYLFGRANVPDNGNRIDDARTELSTAQEQNREVGKHLDNISTGLERDAATTGRISDAVGAVSEGLAGSSNTIKDVESRIGYSQSELRSIEQILDQDDAVLKSVRSRGPVSN